MKQKRSLLQIENIHKNYGEKEALRNVSMSVPKGSVFGLLGPNGAGKTSLIRIINQIILPDSGKIWLDGEELSQKHIAQIGYLPEERGLYKSMKVGEQALYLARLKGLSKEEATQRLKYWFDKFEISDWWNKKIQELSKGMAQKVQFIVTVLHEPKLLIFDEPFSGFDPVNAKLIANEILRLKENGATVIFSTHRMESVEEMCDQIALVNNSEKILEGSLSDLQEKFKSNRYEIGLKTTDISKAKSILSSKYKIHLANFQSLNSNLKLHIDLESQQNSNELFQLLLQLGEVTHFLEEIPTMDTIFRNAISLKEYENPVSI